MLRGYLRPLILHGVEESAGLGRPVGSAVRSLIPFRPSTSGLGLRAITLPLLASASAPPPPYVAIGITELGRNSRKIFGFKGLIGKIFRNKDLAPQIQLKMALGQLRGPSWETAHVRLPQSGEIFAALRVGVCDGRHRSVVMKKSIESLLLLSEILRFARPWNPAPCAQNA